jgi:hypothetical protein
MVAARRSGVASEVRAPSGGARVQDNAGSSAVPILAADVDRFQRPRVEL